MDYKNFVIFEDNEIILVNKPSGLLSIPDGYNPTLPCLKNQLSSSYGRIWTVHRLDKLTSGIILFAKNKEAHRNLNIQFTEHKISKNYRALSHGFPIWKEIFLDCPLKINGDRHHRTIADLKFGKKAATKLIVLKKCDQFCYLDIFPTTGLTHQIRSHSALLGLPIIGDRLYWQQCSLNNKNMRQYPYKYDNMMLHSFSICFNHPKNNEKVTFCAPLPDYFNFFI